MDKEDPAPLLPPQSWLDDLAESEADLDAGRTTSWADIRAELLRTTCDPHSKKAARRA